MLDICYKNGSTIDSIISAKKPSLFVIGKAVGRRTQSFHCCCSGSCDMCDNAMSSCCRWQQYRDDACWPIIPVAVPAAPVIYAGRVGSRTTVLCGRSPEPFFCLSSSDCLAAYCSLWLQSEKLICGWTSLLVEMPSCHPCVCARDVRPWPWRWSPRPWSPRPWLWPCYPRPWPWPWARNLSLCYVVCDFFNGCLYIFCKRQ